MGSPSLADRVRGWLWPVVYRIWRDTIESLVRDRCPVEPYPAPKEKR